MCNKSHRELYPEQYDHYMCNMWVKAKDGTEFKVERVVQSKFGELAPVPGSYDQTAYAIEDLEVLL